MSMPRKESEFYLMNFHQYSKFSLNDITVYLIYRPPSGGATSIDNLTALISAAERRSIFIGDFNLPEINWEDGVAAGRAAAALLEAAESGFMKQMVTDWIYCSQTYRKGWWMSRRQGDWATVTIP